MRVLVWQKRSLSCAYWHPHRKATKSGNSLKLQKKKKKSELNTFVLRLSQVCWYMSGAYSQGGCVFPVSLAQYETQSHPQKKSTPKPVSGLLFFSMFPASATCPEAIPRTSTEYPWKCASSSLPVWVATLPCWGHNRYHGWVKRACESTEGAQQFQLPVLPVIINYSVWRQKSTTIHCKLEGQFCLFVQGFLCL